MEQCWRWFGPNDPINLDYVRQAGATGIVSALHGHDENSAWSFEEVQARKAIIEKSGLRWSVVESIPMPSEIKLKTGNYHQRIAIWKDSLAAVAKAGIKVVNYNFMPVVDWTRTDLKYHLPTSGFALRFDMIDFVAYDAFVLKRSVASCDYADGLLEKAELRFSEFDDLKIAQLEANIIAGLPGGNDTYSRDSVAREIAKFDGVDSATLQSNLFEFIKEIAPVAEELDVRLGIHADDPPFSLFGLPRVVSSEDDFRKLLACESSLSNGITFCVGSMGIRTDNDLSKLVREFAPRIQFAHLRNIIREENGSFHEAEHLEGDSDMVDIVFALMDEQKRREEEGRRDFLIPMRPDHGHLIGDDIGKEENGQRINPGYSYAGRLKGLAELRGIMRAYKYI